MPATTVNVRLIMNNNTASGWNDAASFVPLKGEPIAVVDTVAKTAVFKMGDGTTAAKDLPASTMTPSEIQQLINTTIGGEAVTSVVLSPGTNNGTLKLTVNEQETDNIAVKGLGSAAFTDSDAYATAAQGSKADTAVQSVTIAAGSTNGSIKITVDGSDTEANVTGLGSAAYTESSAYATAAQGALADAAMPKSGGAFTGAVTLAADPTAELGAATKQYVDTKVNSAVSASDAMRLKGTVGTGGTSATLPSGGSVQKGDTYKVISETVVAAAVSFTDAEVTAKVGDTIVMMDGGKWIVIPSGDEAVTAIAYSTTNVTLGTTAKTGTVYLGEAATKQVESTISGAGTANLPTSAAVVSFVEGKGYLTAADNIATADSAAKLTTARNIGLSGGITATAASFDGTQDVNINVTAVSTDLLTNGSNTLVLNGVATA